MKIIYIYTTGSFSGAAMSLAQVLKQVKSKVESIILVPKGSASAFFRDADVGSVRETSWLTQFDHTRYGRYQGLRWLVALREVLLLPYTFFTIRAFASQQRDIDLIHLNEITGIIGAVFLKRIINVPLIVHIRAHMGDQSRGLRSRFLWRILFNRYVDRIICIDETVRSTIPSDIRIPIEVIHNALDLSISGGVSPAPLPEVMIDPKGLVRVAIVGSLIPVKGVYEFFEAAVRLLKRREDLVFIYVGKGVRRMSSPVATIYKFLGLSDNTEVNLKTMIRQSGFASRILMLGHRDDLENIYCNVDLLCFPSHYNAPGRPIFEAGYFGRPSIVAIDNPMPDTLVHGVTGIAIKARDSRALEGAIEWMVENPEKRIEMGMHARALTSVNFNLQSNVKRLIDVYKKCLQS